ncbi:hypothetical protein Mal4_58950 [Maioricimonas rarisocia]|uniref:DUF58 domain-containing protein n=1 Tax=Maioricimonas rarisocia TaxID=2528026 RepID=A0A517ZGB5_9PLAN|nr:DUF58 domain-containing protein [Maioricimonas rarisocia]QDU41527.1 hypothetical protein Mal4_58950 [Maioricimonas rarisocia]
MAGSGAATWIDPVALMQIRSLELRAKAVVEGFFSGLHRSPYHGFSVEFTEYRQYVPGDDPRYLDWRLYARSDRYYVKRFEDETNLRVQLLLDTSRSMQYGSLPHTKADYARTLSATLGYFLNTQRDAVGLMTFDDRIEEMIPPRYRPGHMRRIMLALEQASEGTATDLVAPLDQIAGQLRKRGMLVLISDLLAPVDELETRLGYFRVRGHEVVLFHLLDPAEATLDFEQPALFVDAESGRELYVDPKAARARYLERLEKHLQAVQTSCDRLGVDLYRLRTDTPLENALGDFLRSRQRMIASQRAQRVRQRR